MYNKKIKEQKEIPYKMNKISQMNQMNQISQMKALHFNKN